MYDDVSTAKCMQRPMTYDGRTESGSMEEDAVVIFCVHSQNSLDCMKKKLCHSSHSAVGVPTGDYRLKINHGIGESASWTREKGAIRVAEFFRNSSKSESERE